MKVAVVGAGLAGLTAALRLSDKCDVQLFEASTRVGGQIRTERSNGYLIERGAEGFVARSTAVPELARDVGLSEEQLLAQSVLQSYGFDGAELRPLLPGEAAKMLGFRVAKEEFGRGIRTFQAGMSSLTEALHDRLKGRIELQLGVAIARLEDDRGSLVLSGVDGAVYPADAVVLATSAAVAKTILSPLVPDAIAALSHVHTQSSVTVEFAFERGQIAHPLAGTGFVIAREAQQHGVRACTFSSSKFALRVPEGRVSLRVFLRPDPCELGELPSEQWANIALSGLTRALPVEGKPAHTWISVWPHALPVFHPSHPDHIAKLESALIENRVLLAGAAFHGPGIDAAVRSGNRAARLLIEPV